MSISPSSKRGICLVRDRGSISIFWMSWLSPATAGWEPRNRVSRTTTGALGRGTTEPNKAYSRSTLCQARIRAVRADHRSSTVLKRSVFWERSLCWTVLSWPEFCRVRAAPGAKRPSFLEPDRGLLRCDFLAECYIASSEIRERRRTLRYRKLLVRRRCGPVIQTKFDSPNRQPPPPGV